MSASSYTIPQLLDEVVCGDALETLESFPSDCVDMVVTSPPYFGQRDYGEGRQIGTEASPDEYLDRLVAVFSECRRVLKSTGSLWLNIGDKYVGGRLGSLPWRLAIRLQDDVGLILRSDIIWHKPNAMPSSVKNRPTTDHEYVFMFAKSGEYYYDADSIREPHVTFTEKSRMKGGRNHFGKPNGTPENGKNGGNSNLHDARWDQAFHPKGRNKRTVWEIPLSKFRDAHFAVFPEKLVETCILAGSAPECIVLDPFMGSGTTALVAAKLNRRFIGIDCSQKFCQMARKRVENAQQLLAL
jgi:DNA modification methylase